MKRVWALLLLTGLHATAAAQGGEWLGCASRTHAIDILVDPASKQVLGFGLSVHGEKQDRINWDIVQGTVEPSTQTLDMTARERSTVPREFTLAVRESSARFTLRGSGPEQVQDLSCFWGTIGL